MITSPISQLWVAGRVARVDLLIALITVLGAGIGVWSELTETTHPVPPPVGGYLLAVLAGGLLVGHRRAPLAVCIGISLVCVGYHASGYPGDAVAMALFVGLYSLCAYGRGRRSLLLACELAILIGVMPMLPPHPIHFDTGAIIAPSVGLLAASVAGEAMRAHKVATEERVRRLRQAADDDARRQIVEDRLAIARELHDVLAHTITVIGVQAANGRDALDRDPSETRAALTVIRDATKEAMAQLHSTLQLLRENTTNGLIPPPQPRLADIPQLVMQASGMGVAVRLVTDGVPMDLPVVVELTAYRIVQEALTNVIRHAHADSAMVRISYQPDTLRLIITDDGTGYNAHAGRPGHGLHGMQERARAIGGTLKAGPTVAPTVGFRVDTSLPIGGVG